MGVCSRAMILLAFALLMPSDSQVLGRRVSQATYSRHGRHHQATAVSNEMEYRLRHSKPDTLQIAGSKLPDCSHACRSCSPCHLVMVSFVCSSIQEAETCPMAYKCMCNSKAYPVP